MKLQEQIAAVRAASSEMHGSFDERSCLEFATTCWNNNLPAILDAAEETQRLREVVKVLVRKFDDDNQEDAEVYEEPGITITIGKEAIHTVIGDRLHLRTNSAGDVVVTVAPVKEEGNVYGVNPDTGVKTSKTPAPQAVLCFRLRAGHWCAINPTKINTRAGTTSFDTECGRRACEITEALETRVPTCHLCLAEMGGKKE